MRNLTQWSNSLDRVKHSTCPIVKSLSAILGNLIHRSVVNGKCSLLLDKEVQTIFRLKWLMSRFSLVACVFDAPIGRTCTSGLPWHQQRRWQGWGWWRLYSFLGPSCGRRLPLLIRIFAPEEEGVMTDLRLRVVILHLIPSREHCRTSTATLCIFPHWQNNGSNWCF